MKAKDIKEFTELNVTYCAAEYCEIKNFDKLTVDQKYDEIHDKVHDQVSYYSQKFDKEKNTDDIITALENNIARSQFDEYFNLRNDDQILKTGIDERDFLHAFVGYVYDVFTETVLDTIDAEQIKKQEQENEPFTDKE
jgi:hypothetical protein